MKILAVIPLRLASTRIPKKIMADINGQSLACRTAGRVIRALGDDADVKICAAVDSPLTRDHLKKNFPSLEVIVTDPALPSGTDRVFAAAQACLRDHPQDRATLRGILNVQGDMPFAGVDGLRQAAGFYKAAPAEALREFGMITLAQPWPREVPLDDLGSVKVVADRNGKALYFSRFPIPYSRNRPDRKQLKDENTSLACDLHIGVYGYALEALARLSAHAPVALELGESLEQLRAQWLGIDILVLRTTPRPDESFRGIDTPKDLTWARKFSKAPPGKKSVKPKAAQKKVKRKKK